MSPQMSDAQRKAMFANMNNGYVKKGKYNNLMQNSVPVLQQTSNKMLVAIPSEYVGKTFFTDPDLKDKKFDIDETEYSSDGKISSLKWSEIEKIFEHLQKSVGYGEAQRFLSKVRLDSNIECRDCGTHFHPREIEQHKRTVHGR